MICVLSLAVRAEVRAALRHANAFDGGAAAGTRLAGLLVDEQVILVSALCAVGRAVVAEHGAAVADRLAQHLPDGAVQPDDFLSVRLSAGRRG